MEKYKPAIVIAAYNRKHSLKRLLDSLAKSIYQSEVTLVISIDKSNNEDVLDIANSFEWNNGEKVILKHNQNLGLKKHILECGNLTKTYGSIILLEDDLYVSPFFYIYALDALQYYSTDTNIAGISLYAHSFNVHAKLPFTPVKEDSSVFFMQLPSSWGQAWTIEQWNNFTLWFNSDKNNNNYQTSAIPTNIASWPTSSWLKIFTKYIIENNKYFAYPYVSLTTNFGDAGVNFGRKSSYVQVVLQNIEIKYEFKKFEDANCVYDSYFEMLPSKLKLKADELSNYDFEVDLYGYKPLLNFNKPYFLTTQNCKVYEKSYGLDFKPIEFNVFEENSGVDIFLVKRADFKYNTKKLSKSILFEYYYRMPVIGELFNLLMLKIRQNIYDKIS
ncbi:glycosyltransferase [Flavobacterium psychrotolerans]|uniref:Glycosyl transferase family 2 n=1 Tax=Flavobacterium psychrotolerans TaxID=2169410 RepID=A0A2U1JIA2_9FLAO|nr:glycosyltransferase [Flavobacterium psychrotolerans]PWA04886.1 glycosyl transferase family 2 [Flavobacterium psychrotolerans]